MKSKEAWAVALALSLFFIPVALGQQGSACTTWYVSVCGDETYDASTWRDGIFVNVVENKANGKQVVTLGAGTVDISVNAFTNAGDQAFIGVLDVHKFIQQNPDKTTDLLALMGACNMSAASCDSAIQNFANSVTQGQLKNAALWWHGCINAGDHQTKAFIGLQRTIEGYLIAGQAKSGSSAAIYADITHHPITPQPRTEQICAPLQLGTMPPPGDYTKKLIAHVSLALAPQHGGTVANTRFSIYSPSARGTFAVDASGNVTFSGNVSPDNCPRLPRPQHQPLPLRPISQ